LNGKQWIASGLASGSSRASAAARSIRPIRGRCVGRRHPHYADNDRRNPFNI
jgi:hypothetical protein